MPDVKVRELEKKDEYILMGCDGIWETESSQDILDWIAKSLKTNTLRNTTEALLDHLIAPDTSTGAGCDNMSAIIIQIK